jgi:hypothetical protein
MVLSASVTAAALPCPPLSLTAAVPHDKNHKSPEISNVMIDFEL